MSSQKLTLLRLQKQQRKLDQQPIPHLIVSRQGTLNFHFCIFGLDSPYKNGIYHGVLQLASDYPFSPPRLLFYTPSGRFEVAKPICTSFTNFHKQTWTAGWTIRTMLTATVSFMTSQQQGVGGLNDSYFSRIAYAEKSLKTNMKNEQFRQLFQKKLKQHPQTREKFLHCINNKSEQQSKNPKIQPVRSNKLYFLYIALIILLFIWVAIKSN